MIQELARKNYDLLKIDSTHPSLHFKKVGNFWSARIGLNYRALAVKDGEDYIWVWIGTHSGIRTNLKAGRVEYGHSLVKHKMYVVFQIF